MQRRGFLASSLAASALAGAMPSAEAITPAAEPEAGSREYYELRKYVMRRGPEQPAIDAFFREAAIPGLNRLGVKPVGVFNVTIGPGSPTLYVLTPHASVESAVTIHDRLAADPQYLEAGAAFINTPATEPAYVRVESYLLAAFAAMPRLEVPPGRGREPSPHF